MHSGKPRGEGRGKTVDDGVDDEAAKDAEPQNFGDLDICAVEGLWETLAMSRRIR